MSFDTLGELNWLAVLVATLVYFALGGLWFSNAVFGKAYIRSGGLPTPEGPPGAEFYIWPLIANFVMVLATAMLAVATGSDTFAEGIVLGLVVGIGFAVALGVLAVVFGNIPEKGTFFAITQTYYLIGLLIAAVIVSVWT